MWVEKIDDSATRLTRELLTPEAYTTPVIAAVLWNSERRRLLLGTTPGQAGLALPLIDNPPLIGNFDREYAEEYIALALGSLVTGFGIPEAEISRTYGLLKHDAGVRQMHSLFGDNLPHPAGAQKVFPYLIHLRHTPQVRGYSWNDPMRARRDMLTGKSPYWQQVYRKILARADVLSYRLSKEHLQNSRSQSYSVIPQRGKRNERDQQYRS